MEKLQQILAQEDTVIFVGSGISMWSGLASWSALIEELARFVEHNGYKANLVRSEAQKGDLLQAASYGFDKLTLQQIGEFIRQVCKYGVAKPHDIHKKIVSLGPRCYITTNYDNLIEAALREWQSDQFFKPPITNRQLTSMGEIIHARATNFVFKPHGDAADCESIILTREQYRKLLPQGELHVALESLKLLLASRPVVYLGFGLRDPDFIYIKDILANLYKGGSRDHYALMADVSDSEIDFWRRNYGIHLVSYTTIERSDKSRDHTPLLSLLDTYITKKPEPTFTPRFEPSNPDIVLALARYSAGLARNPKLTREFQLRVHAPVAAQRDFDFYSDAHRFNHSPVDKFLDEGVERSLLIGMPGAGKTYSLRQAAARLANKLHQTCLSEPFTKNNIVVPVFADLKLYDGNLAELVSQTLPKNLPLDEITRHFKVRIFLDSFNEMPRAYWENGSYEADFTRFMDGIGKAALIIGSRTNDGLDKLGMTAYFLDQIDEKDVITELQRLGIKIGGRFEREVRSLLQRPFYFQYVVSGVICLPKEAHPKDFYQSLFKGLQKSFETRFKVSFDLERLLSLVAYDALNQGEEAFPLAELLRTFNLYVEAATTVNVDARGFANWLVSSAILIPYTDGRVAFVHQSVTEYLAAMELARLYQASPHVLMEKLRLTRWDQALFLTLSLLPPDQAKSFLEDVIKADFSLALNASKYIEVNRDEILVRLLQEIPSRYKNSDPFDWRICSAVEFGLPLTELHEPEIRSLIRCGDTLGAAAVQRLVSLKGDTVKDELLQMLFDCRDDFNFCVNGIAAALKPYATDNDAKKIVLLADSIQQKMTSDTDDDAIGGFTSGAADLLAGIDLSVIRREFLPPVSTMEIPKIRAMILCGLLTDHESTAALDFAGELLLRGINDVAYSIHMISEYAKPENKLSWSAYNASHVECLIANLNSTTDHWALCALKNLCAARPELAAIVQQCASKKRGIEKTALLYSVSPADLSSAFQGLSELIEMNDEERQNQPIHLIQAIEFDWSEKEELFSKLILLRDKQLILALLGGCLPPTVRNLGNIKIGPIDLWLDWMMSQMTTDDTEWLIYMLGGLFAQHLGHADKRELVAEFNNPNSKYRALLLKYILPYFRELTIDAFDEDAISFMLADLSRTNLKRFSKNLIAQIATEKFIRERLLPLLLEAKGKLLENLHETLKEAGNRHGQRYVFER